MATATKKKGDARRVEPLRRRAEALLKKSPPPGSHTPAADAQKMVHELGVHQVELEMQNEELRRTELELTRSRDRFSDLYDFAPVGYLTINSEGTVLEANLIAAKMLGVVRNRLVAQPFSRFIEHNSQDSFYRHRRAVFSSGKPDTCELVLRRADRTGLPVHLESLPVTGDAVRRRRCAKRVIRWRKRFASEPPPLMRPTLNSNTCSVPVPRSSIVANLPVIMPAFSSARMCGSNSAMRRRNSWRIQVSGPAISTRKTNPRYLPGWRASPSEAG